MHVLAQVGSPCLNRPIARATCVPSWNVQCEPVSQQARLLSPKRYMMGLLAGERGRALLAGRSGTQRRPNAGREQGESPVYEEFLFVYRVELGIWMEGPGTAAATTYIRPVGGRGETMEFSFRWCIVHMIVHEARGNPPPALGLDDILTSSSWPQYSTSSDEVIVFQYLTSALYYRGMIMKDRYHVPK